MNEQILELRRRGFRVTVQHLRITQLQRDVYASIPRRDPLAPHVCVPPYEGIMLRSARELRENEFDVSPRGGVTIVEVYDREDLADDDVLVGRGVAYCNPEEMFSRKLGTQIAVSRAIWHMGGGTRELARA